MQTFNLLYESVESRQSFPVLISTAEDQTEQRRLVTNKKLRSWRITSPNLTYAKAQAYYNFYNARKGELENFNWVEPYQNTTVRVRFSGEISARYSRGIYKLDFTFVEDPATETL